MTKGYGGMLPAFATITMHTCLRADRAANTLAHISGDTMRSVTSLTSAAILAAALFLTAGTAIAEDAAKPVDPDALIRVIETANGNPNSKGAPAAPDGPLERP